MADTSLGRASLSVTADLSGFTSSLNTASEKVQVFGNTSVAAALNANQITTATEKVTLSLEQLQAAAVSGAINATMFKQTSAAAKMAVDQMVLLDGATLLLMKDENELQFQQAKLNTGYKELENNLLKTDAAFKNNTLLIELNTQKQKLLALENKNVIASMMVVDDQAIGYAASTKTLNAELDINARKLDLQAKQMMLDSGATKALHDELVKLEEQEKALALAEDKVKGINQPVPVIIPPPKVDTNTPIHIAEAMKLATATDMANKALEMQARQMNLDSGATKKLHDEMVRLEKIEQKLIAAENKARGIPPPLPIKPPPIPENKNTAAFVLNAKKMANETDILNKKLDQQARQMMIDSGAAAKLAKELEALEHVERKLLKAEAAIHKSATGRSNAPLENGKTEPQTASGGGLKLKDMMGIGFFTSMFTKIFDGALSLVTSIAHSVIDLGSKIIESGSKFQEVDNRLKAMTGFKGIGKGLQDIMKAGPSASFTALGEAATRLAGMKFRPDAIAGLIKDFNRLGVALGNPEKIVALITDKIADMATNGSADMASLGKIADEQIPVFEALAKRMGVSIDEAKRRVAAGLVTVSEATQAIADAANMPQIAAAAQESANSFSGIWSRVTNNIEVLFQNVGGSILKGFGLVSLNTSINNFFESVSNKAAEFAPMLEKFGAVIAMISAKVLDSIESFLAQWVVTTEKMTVEEMLGEIEIVAERIVKSAIDFITELKPFVEILVAGAKQMVIIASNLGNMKKNMELDAQAAANLFKPKPVDNLDNISILELMDLQNDVMANIDQIDQQIRDVVDTDTSFRGIGGSFMTEMEEELAAFDEQWLKLAEDMANKPLRIEEPGWKKFFADNITPLQQYENELAKLQKMKDDSVAGDMAFALGSAAAIKKLKEATGLGGQQQFASAVHAGSAEEFQVRVDQMGKAKNVQEEIRQLMEAAAEVEAQQLQAAKDIAEAINNLPANMPRPQAIAVAVNP